MLQLPASAESNATSLVALLGVGCRDRHGADRDTVLTRAIGARRTCGVPRCEARGLPGRATLAPLEWGGTRFAGARRGYDCA